MKVKEMLEQGILVSKGKPEGTDVDARATLDIVSATWD